MDELQIERLHRRVQYLEGVIAAFYDFFRLRHDAAIREEVPIEVQVARATDEAYHDE